MIIQIREENRVLERILTKCFLLNYKVMIKLNIRIHRIHPRYYQPNITYMKFNPTGKIDTLVLGDFLTIS